jgi:uncharacterized protein (TIGR02453 family)
MVEPETFEFLTDLAANNRKIWMDAHREERDDAMRNFTGIAKTLHDYSHRFDHNVADAVIKPKQSYTKFFQDARERIGPGLFRTGIDVFSNAGNPSENVGYYLHIEPQNCFAGAGLFQPSKEGLANIRKRLAQDPDGIFELTADPEFKATFSDAITTNKMLNVVPEGYDNAAPAAEYLKMVGLGCKKAIPDALLLDDDVIDLLIETFRAASPLVRYFE